MTCKILIIYDSRSGITEKIAKVVAEGAKRIPGTTVQLKRAEALNAKEAATADAYAFGSPSHFGIMSGKLLTALTDLHSMRLKMAGKPMAVFTTGTGGQVTALENIERIIGIFNPIFVKPGIAIETVPGRATHGKSTKLKQQSLARDSRKLQEKRSNPRYTLARKHFLGE